MKRSIVTGLVVVVVALAACTPGERQTARNALDVTRTLCIVARQALPDAEVMAACDIAEPLFGPAKEILSGSRAAAAQAVAGARVAGAACTGTERRP